MKLKIIIENVQNMEPKILVFLVSLGIAKPLFSKYGESLKMFVSLLGRLLLRMVQEKKQTKRAKEKLLRN